MFGEMLASERTHTPEKRKQYLDIIVRESERLTSLIENVLDFARLERGRASYEFAVADLGEVVTRGIEVFRYRVERERPELLADIAPDLPKTRLDERAMQLLLFNLLDNAVKYAPDSDVVRVRVRSTGRTLTLAVEDHGPGIDPDDARRVFERGAHRHRARVGHRARARQAHRPRPRRRRERPRPPRGGSVVRRHPPRGVRGVALKPRERGRLPPREAPRRPD
jgi:two-component system phosphate regulon sensor histidine kinase PhoR